MSPSTRGRPIRPYGGNSGRGCRGALYMRPGRRLRNDGCHGRIFNPPLRVPWKLVGVDVPIDPSAQRPLAAPTTRCTTGLGVGAHCICARGAVAIPAGFPKTYCGTGGYIIRPYGGNSGRGCRGALYMRPGRRLRNDGCHGRIFNPPLRVPWKLVGVDVPIDPSAQRPLAAPTTRCTTGLGVGAHCICARGAVAIPAGFPKTYCGTGGYIIRPYRVRCKLVGVDVLIDPCRAAAKNTSRDRR